MGASGCEATQSTPSFCCTPAILSIRLKLPTVSQVNSVLAEPLHLFHVICAAAWFFVPELKLCTALREYGALVGQLHLLPHSDCSTLPPYAWAKLTPCILEKPWFSHPEQSYSPLHACIEAGPCLSKNNALIIQSNHASSAWTEVIHHNPDNQCVGWTQNLCIPGLS